MNRTALFVETKVQEKILKLESVSVLFQLVFITVSILCCEVELLFSSIYTSAFMALQSLLRQ